MRVKSRAFLKQFQREWKYHHPVSNEQIDAAGVVDTVKGVGFYHGGDVLYQLSKLRGHGMKIVSKGSMSVNAC